MKNRSAPAVWALFVLLLVGSLSVLFTEQSKSAQFSPAAISQPGTLSLAPATASQGFFVPNISLSLLLLLIALISFAFHSKRFSRHMLHPAANVLKKNTSEADETYPKIKLSPHTPEQGADSGLLSSEMEMLREELQKKEDFIAIASHELKTPLASLKIYIQSLQLLTAIKSHNEYDQYLEKINTQIDKLNRLVSTLLDVARIEGGKITYNKENFDLRAVVASITSDIQMMNGHSIKIEGTIPRLVYGDRERIAQVIENLISNAIKYSPGKAEIEIGFSHNDNEAIASITDHGIGIDEKYHKKIFDRFFRINRDIEGAYSGMGVGLFLSSQIIGHHGGAMWLESKKGFGSTFYFSLPFAKEST